MSINQSSFLTSEVVTSLPPANTKDGFHFPPTRPLVLQTHSKSHPAPRIGRQVAIFRRRWKETSVGILIFIVIMVIWDGHSCSEEAQLIAGYNLELGDQIEGILRGLICKISIDLIPTSFYGTPGDHILSHADSIPQPSNILHSFLKRVNIFAFHFGCHSGKLQGKKKRKSSDNAQRVFVYCYGALMALAVACPW